jgi:hypothetical protein
MLRAVLFVVAATATAYAETPRPLDRDAIRKAVTPHVGELQTCYEKHLVKNPGAAGRVTTKIAIATDGRVASVTATGIHANVEACITKQIKAWKFPAHPGPQAVEIAYPFEFVAPAAKAPAAEKAAAVDPKLVAMFDQAAAQDKAKKHAAALALYRKVLETQRKEKLAAIPRFIATTHMQASYSLIDLGRLKEAKAELKLVEVATLTKPQQYDYHFTLGNVLGGLGELKPMFSSMVEAISMAEDLDDLTERPPLVWKQILAFTLKAKDWAYLKEVSAKALQVAQVRGYKDVEAKAKAAAAEAQKHLGK